MKVNASDNINKYYIQMLCMIYFPGVKFSEHGLDDGMEITVNVSESEEGVVADVLLSVNEKISIASKFEEYKAEIPQERTVKVAVGAAVISAAGDMLGYRSSWGMLTGVRPSKVANELLSSGYSKTRVKKILNSEYFVIPKKASLATEVAIAENAIIGTPDPKDCSIYIAIPFCPSRCAYSSFVSYTSKKLLSLIPEYIVRLIEDIKAVFATIKKLGLNLKTIYIGGGTPTILTAEQLQSGRDRRHNA